MNKEIFQKTITNISTFVNGTPKTIETFTLKNTGTYKISLNLRAGILTNTAYLDAAGLDCKIYFDGERKLSINNVGLAKMYASGTIYGRSTYNSFCIVENTYAGVEVQIEIELSWNAGSATSPTTSAYGYVVVEQL